MTALHLVDVNQTTEVEVELRIRTSSETDGWNATMTVGDKTMFCSAEHHEDVLHWVINKISA